MCGRFTLISEFKAIQDHFAAGGPTFAYQASYNIAPTREIPAVRQEQAQRELFMCRWGLIPHWSKPGKSYHSINARAETLASKPFFRDAFRKRRCLIPANGFFEWKKEGAAKQAYYIHLPDRPLFAFAGLWEYWLDQEQRIESCAIITTTANTGMQAIHDRMPVILQEQDYAAWLEAGGERLLIPYAGSMECYPVSKFVNNPRNDGKDLIDRIT
jgi:putative SOS response-associated peptidase YedK